LPIFPIGQAYAGDHYTPTEGDYRLFEKTCKELGYTGVSFWRHGTMSDTMKAAIKAMSFPYVPPAAKDYEPCAWAAEAWKKAIDLKIIQGDGTHPPNPRAEPTLE
jgi:hypothetical protein